MNRDHERGRAMIRRHGRGRRDADADLGVRGRAGRADLAIGAGSDYEGRIPAALGPRLRRKIPCA